MILLPVFGLKFFRSLQKVTIKIVFQHIFPFGDVYFWWIWFKFIYLSPCPLDHNVFKQFQPMEGIEHDFHIIWNPSITHSWRIEEAIQENIWLYWFQSKRIPIPWIVTKSMLSPATSIFGMDCDVIDGSYLIIFLEKNTFTHKNWKPKKDLTITRTKWKKPSESVYPKNALESIVLLLSMLKVLLNMYDLISCSCNMLS